MTPVHHPAFVSRTAICAALAAVCVSAHPVWAADAQAVAAKSKPEAAKVAMVSPDPLDKLRERLAERLSAVKLNEKPGAVDVHVAPGAAHAEPASATANTAPPALIKLSAASHRGPAKSAAKQAAAQSKTSPHDAAHWSYAGAVGPQAWGGMRAEFSLCASGQRQSPIDIREGIAVDLEPVRFNYQPGGFAVIDNGHTVQVNLSQGNSMEIGGERFELLQFHFHRPSEERIDGRQFDMVAHLVHKNSEGKLAVVAVLLDKGSVQPVVQMVWNNLPLEKHQEVRARGNLDMNQLLPTDRRYFTYMGSLTTPPCSEGVRWVVLRHPVALSPEQIDVFSRMYPMNARPVQSASGRRIMQSN